MAQFEACGMVFQTKKEPTQPPIITPTKTLNTGRTLAKNQAFQAQKSALLAAKYLHGEVKWPKSANGHFFLRGMGFPLVQSFWKNSTPSQGYDPDKNPFFQGGTW